MSLCTSLCDFVCTVMSVMTVKIIDVVRQANKSHKKMEVGTVYEFHENECALSVQNVKYI